MEPSKSSIAIVLGVSAILLASCSSAINPLWREEVTPFPTDWAPIARNQVDGSCPQISGIFYDLGKYGANTDRRPCNPYTDDCLSLEYNLLFDAQVWNREIERNRVDYVHIEQPSLGVIEITTQPGGEQRRLSILNGDFTCDEYGLRLKEKNATLIGVFTNRLASESRIFNISNDGTLVMKIEYSHRGHWFIVPVDKASEGWVRWHPGSASLSERFPPSESQIPDTVSCFSGGKRQWVERSHCD